MEKSENSFLSFQIDRVEYVIATEYVVRIYVIDETIQQKEMLEDIPLISLYSEAGTLKKGDLFLILKCKDQKFGMYVNQVNEVININGFYKLPEIMKCESSRYIKGVLLDKEKKKLIYVLSIEEFMGKLQ